MKVNSFIRMICVALALLICCSIVVVPTSASSSAAQKNLADMEKYLAADTYAAYSERYTNAQIAAGDQVYVGTPNMLYSDAQAKVLDLSDWESNEYLNSSDYKAGAVWSPSEGQVTFSFNINVTGMYYVMISYYNVAQTVNSIERKLYIDGDLPFQEAKLVQLTKTWTYEYEDNQSFRKDLNGNDLTPQIQQYSRWQTCFVKDVQGYSNDYYRFYVTAGTHTISLDSIREGVVIGSLSLIPVDDADYGLISYQEYLAKVKALGATEVGSQYSTKIQAEKPDYVSDSSVVMANNKKSAITEPSIPTADLYNVIGETSYSSVGQWAGYKFTVEKTGLYNLTMRFLQEALEGMFISRSIKLQGGWKEGAQYKYGLEDGTATIPFSEAFSSRFNYGKEWQVTKVGDGTNEFLFYFEEGVEYTIYFEVSLGALATQLERVENAMTILNDCYLQILKLTGSNPDAYSDYNFGTVLPDVMYYLNYYSVELQDIRDHFEAICGSSGSHLATLDNVIRLIATMATDETEIAKNLATFKSYLGTLGTWMSDSQKSTLIVDYITVQSPSANLGKAKAGFFKSIWFEIRAFFSSFFTDYDQMGVTNEEAVSEDALVVWLALGRDQSKVVRNLIDSQFSDFLEADNYSEFPVSLKLVTAGTLLPSILAGKGPDVYMGLDSTTLMNYAIRDAILPITSMSGFDTVKTEFHSSAIDSVTLLGETYGIPMTMSFAMMFYRSDVLVNLNSPVPETWDELLALLPSLQANNMEIGLTYTLALDFFLYQNGGNMWKYIDDVEYQGAQIALDTDEGLSAFNFCTQLFTEYSFPVAFSAANRFRTGEMPIVISDYVSTYNTLIVYATELDGLWSFSHIPGIQQYDDNGKALVDSVTGERVINYTAISDVSSAVVTKSGEKRIRDAWEYIKWCTSADYTSSYANNMVSLLGPSAKHAAANMNALDDMSWTNNEVTAIKEQMNQLGAIVRYPGYYIVARYTNFAFLAAVNDGADPIDSLRSYITAINAEVTRKREEFGMKTLEAGEVPPSYQNQD